MEKQEIALSEAALKSSQTKIARAFNLTPGAISRMVIEKRNVSIQCNGEDLQLIETKTLASISREEAKSKLQIKDFKI